MDFVVVFAQLQIKRQPFPATEMQIAETSNQTLIYVADTARERSVIALTSMFPHSKTSFRSVYQIWTVIRAIYLQ